MSFQPLFQRFHQAIQLNNFNENAELREKRDRVLNRLRDSSSWTFEWFNQGSYAMGTGIKPLNGDYDIDIGVVFNGVYIHKHDPVDVKSVAYNAVASHTTRVEWRRPCITVYYQQAGEAIYHVDLAIFATDQYTNQLHLAIGKQYSAREQRAWQPDDRKGFIEDVKNRFSGDDGAQFRRVIRYLKRWKDVHFPVQGNAAPSGLALTVAAYYWFQPSRDWQRNYNDLEATAALVRSIQQHFVGSYLGPRRLALQFPRAPRDDVFERMTDQQMQEFYQRLEKLTGWLDEARRNNTTQPLRNAFGQDFPAQ